MLGQIRPLFAFYSLSIHPIAIPYHHTTRLFVRPTDITSTIATITTTSLHSSSSPPASFQQMFPSQREAQEHVCQTAKSKSTNSDDDDGKGIHMAKCGMLACQHDSFRTTLDTSKIVSYAQFAFQTDDSKSKKQKKKEKKELNNAAEGSDDYSSKYSSAVYAIALTDSVFFPEGGGQPADQGTLTLQKQTDNKEDDSDNVVLELYVQDAQNIQEVCVLFCRAPSSTSNDDICSNWLEEKDHDVQIVQEIDWDRRYDLMTQHSAQHLVSAVAISEYDIDTHTFSLGKDKTTSYIDFTIDESWDKDYASSIFSQIEDKANAHIRSNVPMTPTWVDPNTNNDDGSVNDIRSRLLPSGFSGPLRLVRIGEDIDLNTCCGTHVPTLGQLHMIKFFRMEKVKSTIFRVYFASAKRLLTIMDGMYDRQAQLTNMLSCAETEQIQRVTQLLEDKREKEREIQNLNKRLCACQSKEVMDECKTNDNHAVLDLGDVDMWYMTMLSTAVLEKMDTEDVLLLLVGGKDGSDEGSFLLTGNKHVVDQVGREVAGMLQGRGGGKNGKFQGKGTRIRSSLPDVKKFLMNQIQW